MPFYRWTVVCLSLWILGFARAEYSPASSRQNLAFENAAALLEYIAKKNDVVIYLDSPPLKSSFANSLKFINTQTEIKNNKESIINLLDSLDYECAFSGRSVFCTKKYSSSDDFIDMEFEELILSIDRLNKTLSEHRRLSESKRGYKSACQMFRDSLTAFQKDKFDSDSGFSLKYEELNSYQKGILHDLYWMKAVERPIQALGYHTVLREIIENKKLKFGWKKITLYPCFIAEAEYRNRTIPIAMAPIGSVSSAFSQSMLWEASGEFDPSEPKPADYVENKPLPYPWEVMKGESITDFLKREFPEREVSHPFVGKRQFFVFGEGATTENTKKYLETNYGYVDYSENDVKKFGVVPGRIKIIGNDVGKSIDFAISPLIRAYIKGSALRSYHQFFGGLEKKLGDKFAERMKNRSSFYPNKYPFRIDELMGADGDDRTKMIRRLRVLLERPGGDKYQLTSYTELSPEAKKLADMILFHAAFGPMGALSGLAEYKMLPGEDERIVVFREPCNSEKIVIEVRKFLDIPERDGSIKNRDIVMDRFASDAR